MSRDRIVSFKHHRSWCSLFGGKAHCDCGQQDVVDVVLYWSTRATTKPQDGVKAALTPNRRSHVARVRAA